MIRRAAAVLALLTALVLTACSPISAGTITSKDHRDGYYTTSQQCVSYGKDGLCRQYIPIQNWNPPSWKFSLRELDKEGWVYVNEDTYNRYEVGDYFDADN